MNTIDELIDGKLQEGVIITGGHFGFDRNGEEMIDPGTVITFFEAVELYARARASGLKHVGIGLLVNNIGASCGSREAYCDRGWSILQDELDKFRLPQIYESALQQREIPHRDVEIVWEKYLRNCAKRLYRKHHALDVGEDVSLKGHCAHIPLFRYQRKYNNHVAACPAIMAAFHVEQERRGYTSSINLYNGRSDNTNHPHINAISKGTYAGERLGWIASSDHTNLFYRENARWHGDTYLKLLRTAEFKEV